MAKLRMAVIGAGGMAGRHARLYKDHPRADLVCICDIVEEKARQQAAQLGCDYVTDYRRLLDRTDVDAVMVGTPNPLHYRIALDCLRAGKHTAVEYPIAQTVEQHDTLYREARQRKLVVHHALTPLREPQAQTVKANLAAIGQVVCMRSAYFAVCPNTMWYVHSDRRGNFFAALTIHQIVYFNVVLDQSPDWVQGVFHFRENPDQNSHAGCFLAHYPGGVYAYNDWGMGFGAPSVWEWIIEGDRGRIVYERPPKQNHRLRILAGRDEQVARLALFATAAGGDQQHRPPIEAAQGVAVGR